jgi:hypothetical protein
MMGETIVWMPMAELLLAPGLVLGAKFSAKKERAGIAPCP